MLKALNIHLLYNITGLSFDHNSREIQTRSTSLILIPPETGRRVLPHRDSHRDEVVDENGKFRGLGNENARGCRRNNASKTMRRKFRKSKGPVAREGCIGGWVRASSIDSRRGISADYTRQPSKKKEGKEESGYGGRERVL